MGKQKLHLERHLNTKSLNIIWQSISTPEGLSNWFADEVEDQGGTFVFKWGDPNTGLDVKKAKLVDKQKCKLIRFEWEDNTGEGGFLELEISKSELTNDYTLSITDFAVPEDLDTLRDIWDDNLRRMHEKYGF